MANWSSTHRPLTTSQNPNKERRNLEVISSDLSGDVILEFRGCSEDRGILSRLPLVTSQPPKNNVIVSNFHFFFSFFTARMKPTLSSLLNLARRWRLKSGWIFSVVWMGCVAHPISFLFRWVLPSLSCPLNTPQPIALSFFRIWSQPLSLFK